METRFKADLAEQGWKPGDPAWQASYGYGDEFEPARWDDTIGLYRSLEEAKQAVEAMLLPRSAEETREGVYWWGEVEPGAIEDESSNWGTGYGWVEDWGFHPDDRAASSWINAENGGKLLGWND